MKIVFALPDAALADAAKLAFEGLEDVAVVRGSIFEVECDAIVSPANSFGFMDGGIDAAYTSYFGIEIQNRVRERILYDHQGELLVGQATIVATDRETPRFLISAPTMRVPMHLGPNTVNPYLAARAAILLARTGPLPTDNGEGNRKSCPLDSIAFPGMGTGVGGVPAKLFARQMREAIVKHRSAPHTLPTSWAQASEDHQLLYTDSPVRLQR